MSLATITSLRRNLQEWALRPSNAKFLKQDQENWVPGVFWTLP